MITKTGSPAETTPSNRNTWLQLNALYWSKIDDGILQGKFKKSLTVLTLQLQCLDKDWYKFKYDSITKLMKYKDQDVYCKINSAIGIEKYLYKPTS